ncbi:MAG TPA: hypothetical protein VMU94_11320 [Streptosporangiaceae bacterium]|nr:hypothetical protein [Streptosporangiaceae bacterium]
MTLSITEKTMTSDTTPHSAHRHPELNAWRVTWLADRELTRNQAMTAMMLAEKAAAQELPSERDFWPHIDGWAAELGLGSSDAIGRIVSATLDMAIAELEA